MPKIDLNGYGEGQRFVAPPEPPRHTFRNRLIATIICLVVAAGVVVLLFVNMNPVDFISEQFGISTSSSSSSASDSSEADDPVAEPAPPAVEPKASLAEYSWEELAQIADLISASRGQGEALALARDYGLVDEQGRLTGQTKPFTLDDGRVVDMTIAGFYHDELPDGGRAGISFITATPPFTASMNDTMTNAGGWEGSELRALLQNELRAQLPDELSSLIKPVIKSSNNTGVSYSQSAVTPTEDAIWIPSFVEVAGPVTNATYWHRAADQSLYDIYSLEGRQYQWFSDMGVSAGDPQGGILARIPAGEAYALDWWERSASPAYDGRFLVVSTYGDPSAGADVVNRNGVMFGFCL